MADYLDPIDLLIERLTRLTSIYSSNCLTAGDLESLKADAMSLYRKARQQYKLTPVENGS